MNNKINTQSFLLKSSIANRVNQIANSLLTNSTPELFRTFHFHFLLRNSHTYLFSLPLGTDARYGVGFRLGEHADFQVMVELGPQKETQPIGVAASSTNKRQVDPQDFPVVVPPPKKAKVSNTPGGKWISNWSINSKKPEFDEKPKQKIMPFIAQDSLKQLQQLMYGSTDAPPPQLSSEASYVGGDTIGTLPASILDQRENKFKIVMPDLVRPGSHNEVRNTKSKAKITADLMDVDFDD